MAVPSAAAVAALDSQELSPSPSMAGLGVAAWQQEPASARSACSGVADITETIPDNTDGLLAPCWPQGV